MTGGYQLGTILNGIVAASLAAGCGGATQEHEPGGGGAQSTGGSHGGNTSDGGRSAGGTSAGGALAHGGSGAGGSRIVHATCANGVPWLTEALDPAEAADFIGVYLYSVPSGTMLFQSWGTACSGAVDAEACQRALIGAFNQTMGFPPLGADTLPAAPERAFAFVIVTREERVTVITDEAGLRAFLGPIDTPNEAALRLFLAAYTPHCEGFTETADGYGATYMTMGSGCSYKVVPAEYYVRVNRDASVSATIARERAQCVGRRPQGLQTRRQQGMNELGSYFAEVAQLEAAAVFAFEEMTRELQSFDAPIQLRSAARQARADEVRHAAQFANLARAHGVEPAAPRVDPVGGRSMLEMALENATEGVVRETWGALCAAWQALHASDVHARSVLQATAADEARHAELSRDVDAWLHSLLSTDEQLQVLHAKRQAIADLRAELASSEPHPNVIEAAGVPNRARSLDLLNRLERELL